MNNLIFQHHKRILIILLKKIKGKQIIDSAIKEIIIFLLCNYALIFFTSG